LIITNNKQTNKQQAANSTTTTTSQPATTAILCDHSINQSLLIFVHDIFHVLTYRSSC
jgi:hypothetical protein